MRAGLLLGVTLTLPLVLATGWVLAVAAGERTGHRPFAVRPYRNSAEAAAAGDPAAVLRMLRAGDNPTWIHSVHPELISSEIRHVTTLEAALWAREMGLIRALDREGAIVDPDQRRDLGCLARDLDLATIADYLAPDAACVPNAALERVRQRSAGPGARGGDE